MDKIRFHRLTLRRWKWKNCLIKQFKIFILRRLSKLIENTKKQIRNVSENLYRGIGITRNNQTAILE